MSQLHDMEIFLAAARLGSFTEAAKNLRMSLAAVSRAVARLEQHMGCRLFNRTTRRLKLTEDGRFALEEISAGIERLENARMLLQERRASASGTLKVLLPSTFFKHYMMPDLVEFLEAHPQLELDLHFDDFAADLLLNGVDVAVQYAPVPVNGYISRALGSLELVLVASPDYLARNGIPRRIEDLGRHKRIQLRGQTGGPPYQWNLKMVGGESIEVHRPAGQCFINSQLDVIVHTALSGLGIAPLDLRAVARYLESGELKIILPDYRLVGTSDVLLLYPHRDHLPLKARVFMDFLVDVSRQNIGSAAVDVSAFAA